MLPKTLRGVDVDVFKHLFKKQGSTFTKEVKGSERALVASFVASEQIAMEMKACNIGEKLIKPVCKEMVSHVWE